MKLCLHPVATWVIASSLALAPGAAIAQDAAVPKYEKPSQPIPPQTAGGRNQKYETLTIRPDGTVTFRIGAPTASEVHLLVGEASMVETTYPMAKDKDGVWSTTVAFDPDIYHYTMMVNGAKANFGSVEVPGTATAPYDVQNVPHGSVNAHDYYSTAQKRFRSVDVYVPAEYYSEPGRRFPVLYMWKPGGQEEWLPGEHQQAMFDNLIGQKKAVPMIVVMPGIEVPPDVSQGSPEARDLLEKDILNDIIPMVEKHYRTINDREHRAIAGISQSGATAFTIGMRNLKTFGSVGEFGTGFFGGLLNPPGYTSYVAYDPEKVAPGIYQNLVAPATKPKLFYMSVGTLDPRNPYQKKAYEDFVKHGATPVFRTFPGGHEYMVWRPSLADMATMLFK